MSEPSFTKPQQDALTFQSEHLSSERELENQLLPLESKDERERESSLGDIAVLGYN
jgi:hypothetical protein